MIQPSKVQASIRPQKKLLCYFIPPCVQLSICWPVVQSPVMSNVGKDNSIVRRSQSGSFTLDDNCRIGGNALQKYNMLHN